MPGRLTYASAGIGTAQHLEAELLQRKLAINMVHVPYRGATAALVDVAAGHVSLMFTPVANALGMIQSGRVRPIGLATSDILPALPNIKPLSELGVSNFYADSWFMLVAPARTPQHIIETLRQQMAAISRDAEFTATLTQQGLVPVNDLSADELNALIDKEAYQWREVITQGGISLE
jgi:tripartite-type tricarboxylate transporter receptor subunit TctC